MAAKARKGSACPVATGLQATDSLLSVATQNSVVNTFIVTTKELLSNTNSPHITTGNNAVSTANLVIRSLANIPSASATTGVAGQIVFDGNFIYVCISANSWKRAALSTF